MDFMTDLGLENLRKGAQPVDCDAINDLVQSKNICKIGCGRVCRVNPLTDRGKRYQLLRILSLTLIPIMSVWGFTMLSLSDSVSSKSDIEVAKVSMTVVVMLGQIIHRLQRERDMSVLYLSDLGPGTKTFLLAEYSATDDALRKLSIWPDELKISHRVEFRSKNNLMNYISQHRKSMNPSTVDLYDEVNFYSSITSGFVEWLVENIKGSGFGSIWKKLVTYQKITRCKEDIGVERVYGAMFYAYGGFPSWSDFEFYNEQINDFKYNYKTAVLYSTDVVQLHTEEMKSIQLSGVNITSIINFHRNEIQYHVPLKNYASNSKAKWFFGNMTEYLDSLLLIQEKVGNWISEEVDIVLARVVSKVWVYACMVVIVIGICPLIIFSSQALATDIQKCTQILVHKETELNIERHKTDILMFQMIPMTVAVNLRNDCSHTEADFFKAGSVLQADIFGFNQIAMEISPAELSTFLNTLHASFDKRIENYDVCKVEKINDSIMVASGIPRRNGDAHVTEIATLALDLLHATSHMPLAFKINRSLKIRIGIHTGSFTAGVVGAKMLRYCLFGDTIFIVCMMKSKGLPGKIHVSDKMFTSLLRCGKFKMKCRGSINISPTKKMTTYWLLDKNEFDSGNVDPTGSSSFDDCKQAFKDAKFRNYFERNRSSAVSIEDHNAIPASVEPVKE